jgi:hypothetical protein
VPFRHGTIEVIDVYNHFGIDPSGFLRSSEQALEITLDMARNGVFVSLRLQERIELSIRKDRCKSTLFLLIAF